MKEKFLDLVFSAAEKSMIKSQANQVGQFIWFFVDSWFIGRKLGVMPSWSGLRLYRILIWPDIRSIILPDTGYSAGYPSK